MSNKNSNKNNQTKSVESCIEYIDGKPIVKVLFAWGYCSTFILKKALEQQFNKFRYQYSDDVPFDVILAQFFNQLKDNCNFDFNNSLSSEEYKTVLELITCDGYAKSSCCKNFYFTQAYGDSNTACKLHIVNVDASRPWTIENNDGLEYIRYLDTKDYKKSSIMLNFFVKEQ